MAKVEFETTLTDEKRSRFRAQGAWGDRTLVDWFEVALTENDPDSDAVVDSFGNRLSWAELAQQVANTAAGLRQLGIGRGDIVVYQISNRPEVNVLDLAIMLSGAVVCPVPYLFGSKEVSHILKVTRAAVLITQDSFRNIDFPKTLAEIRPGLPDLKHVFVFGDPGEYRPFGELAAKGASLDDFADVRPNADDVAVIIFSSGTTGTPKGIMHTHNTLLLGVRVWEKECRLERGDVALAVAPAGTAPATCSGVWLTTYLGSKSVWLASWDPEEALRLIEREKVVFIDGPTAFPLGMLHHPERSKYNIDSLKSFPCGGAPIPRELFEESAAAGFKMQSMLGSVEALWCIMHAYDDPKEKVLISEGRPLAGTEIRIVDEGREVTPGETGEILYRGPMLMVGYFASPEQTAATFDSDGWWHSGDLVRRDADGYVSIVGRKKDIIIRKGMKIDPIEIEHILFSHPKVKEAAAVGMPDPEAGEKVCIYAIPVSVAEPPTLGELCEALLEKGVAKYKLPERLEIVGEFPRGPTGKVLKYVLRDKFTPVSEGVAR